MANITFLQTTDSATKPLFGEDRFADRLLTANYSMPVFWHALFDEADMVTVPSPPGGGGPYWALTTPAADGLARARRRGPNMRRVLGAQNGKLYAMWVDFIETHAKKFLHCETFELVGLCSKKGVFARQLRTALRAFDHLPPSQKGKPILNRWWRMLLSGMTTQETDGTIRSVSGDYGFCGIGWDLTVPWGLSDD